MNGLLNHDRIRNEWLSVMPHMTKINSAFALRDVADRTAIVIVAEMA